MSASPCGSPPSASSDRCRRLQKLDRGRSPKLVSSLSEPLRTSVVVQEGGGAAGAVLHQAQRVLEMAGGFAAVVVAAEDALGGVELGADARLHLVRGAGGRQDARQ